MPLFPGHDPAAVQACAEQLVAGALVAFATETVYGLGARADDDSAVAKVFATKGRPADHPLIVHVASESAALFFSPRPSEDAQRLMAAFWPGPMTVVVPRHPGRGAAAASGQDSVGLRMPSHPVALALLSAAAAMGVAGVAAPSANRFGRVSPTTAAHVQQELGLALWVLDGGPCQVGIESAIIDCTGARPALLRPGVIGRARIEQVLGMPLEAPDASSPRAPGTLASHYAPAAAVRLFGVSALHAAVAAAAEAPGVVGVYSHLAPAPFQGLVWREMPATPAAVAHDLFAVLREFDAQGVSCIWVEQPPLGPNWEGVRDRLQRAAAA